MDSTKPVQKPRGGGNQKHAGEKRCEQFFKYEHVLWTIHTLVTILAIIDRFTTNINPRQSYRIGKGSAGNDRMVGLKEGPWSVAVYDILARVSGRYCIVTFNFMLIVRYVLHWDFIIRYRQVNV